MPKSINNSKYSSNYWVPDSESNRCGCCRKEIVRSCFRSGKHHCRQCGIIICSGCVSDTRLTGVQMLKYSPKNYSESSSVKVCIRCEEEQNHLTHMRSAVSRYDPPVSTLPSRRSRIDSSYSRRPIVETYPGKSRPMGTRKPIHPPYTYLEPTHYGSGETTLGIEGRHFERTYGRPHAMDRHRPRVREKAPNTTRRLDTCFKLDTIFRNYPAYKIHNYIPTGMYKNRYDHLRDRCTYGAAIKEEQARKINLATGNAYFSLLISCSGVIAWHENYPELIAYHNLGTDFRVKRKNSPKFKFFQYLSHRPNPKVIILSGLTEEEIKTGSGGVRKTIYEPFESHGISMEHVRIFAGACMPQVTISNGQLGLGTL